MLKNTVAAIWCGLAMSLLLASCTTPAPAPSPIPHPIIGAEPTYPEDLRGAALFQVLPDSSVIHILVYRGGTLSNLGHNHVISSHGVNGYIWKHEQTGLCGFDIALPVNDLIVDDNDARAAEGAEFPVDVPDSARQGTQHNMLSEALLDAEHYPMIRLQSANISGDVNSPQVVVHITIKNQLHLYTLPVSVAAVDQGLQVRGEFTIKQTDFGIKPYSVAMGALQVQDELKIRFDLQASRLIVPPRRT
jgi:hypothetical protein